MLSDFIDGYTVGVFFTEYGLDPSDFSEVSKESIAKDCQKFYKENRMLWQGIENGDSRAGFLFWLNRNGRGSGFWDEDSIPTHARILLSDRSHEYGESSPYVGDDGKIYLCSD